MDEKGLLKRIDRGLYRNKQVHVHAEITFQWEDLVHTALLIPHGVITGISALCLYGLTEEIARFHWIAVPNGTSIAPRANTKILRLRCHDLGITTIKIGDIEVPIYNIERTLVDSFRFLSIEAAIKAAQRSLSASSEK